MLAQAGEDNLGIMTRSQACHIELGQSQIAADVLDGTEDLVFRFIVRMADGENRLVVKNKDLRHLGVPNPGRRQSDATGARLEINLLITPSY